MDQGIMTLITVAVVLAAVAFVLWLLYTVIWHGVRRGMQEFAYVRRAVASSAVAPSPDVAPALAGHHHHRVLRRVPDDAVPDYVPRDWV